MAWAVPHFHIEGALDWKGTAFCLRNIHCQHEWGGREWVLPLVLALVLLSFPTVIFDEWEYLWDTPRVPFLTNVGQQQA